MYRQYPFSEQKQRKAKVKVRETDPTCSQIWLFPVTEFLQFALGKYFLDLPLSLNPFSNLCSNPIDFVLLELD